MTTSKLLYLETLKLKKIQLVNRIIILNETYELLKIINIINFI